MKIAVIHDYADVFRGTRAYPRLKDHEVTLERAADQKNFFLDAIAKLEEEIREKQAVIDNLLSKPAVRLYRKLRQLLR